MKLTTGRPIDLPIVRLQIDPSPDLEALAATLFPLVCAVELALAGLILLGGRWSRWLALAVLLAFVGVLIPHLRVTGDSCGCFGVIPSSPRLMLINAAAGAALVVLLPATGNPLVARPWRWCVVWCVAAFGLVYGVHAARLPEALGWRAPQMRLRPDTWTGKRLADLPFFASLERAPGEDRFPPFAEGEQTWVIWQNTCPHCHAYFSERWNAPTSARVVAVERPLSSRGFGDEPRAIDCPSCVRLRLKPGTFYFISSTPVVLNVRDGVVESVEINPVPLRFDTPEVP